MTGSQLSHLEQLEAESIHVLREVFEQFERPVFLYSIGKDSSVLLRLVEKAFAPGPIPFPLLHVDTGYKFPDMIAFRDELAKRDDLELIVHRNEAAIADGASPFRLGLERCCGLLKTEALLQALRQGQYDAAIGGARRDEERSRAKERFFSFRDEFGQWEPRSQRPELWHLFNGRLGPGESIRAFPLSNWTELDVWLYIVKEEIPIHPLYFAQEREVIRRGDQIIPVGPIVQPGEGEVIERVLCRFRSLGCYPCTGAMESNALSLEDIAGEMLEVRASERATRLIDHDRSSAMEKKKREGYF